jgi:hypothetical protein
VISGENTVLRIWTSARAAFASFRDDSVAVQASNRRTNCPHRDGAGLDKPEERVSRALRGHLGVGERGSPSPAIGFGPPHGRGSGRFHSERTRKPRRSR